MSDFKVDLEAMSSFVESLSSFEEKAKEYDVEDWVPNSGMLENPEVWGSHERVPGYVGKGYQRLA